ncbi:MAG TPA: hypothetical protein VIY30_11900 [Burkholderiaceae bacterium]
MTELLDLLRTKFDIDTVSIALSKPELLLAVEDHFYFEYPEQYTGVPTLSVLAEVADGLRAPAAARRSANMSTCSKGRLQSATRLSSEEVTWCGPSGGCTELCP